MRGRKNTKQSENLEKFVMYLVDFSTFWNEYILHFYTVLKTTGIYTPYRIDCPSWPLHTNIRGPTFIL